MPPRVAFDRLPETVQRFGKVAVDRRNNDGLRTLVDEALMCGNQVFHGLGTQPTVQHGFHPLQLALVRGHSCAETVLSNLGTLAHHDVHEWHPMPLRELGQAVDEGRTRDILRHDDIPTPLQLHTDHRNSEISRSTSGCLGVVLPARQHRSHDIDIQRQRQWALLRPEPGENALARRRRPVEQDENGHGQPR